ncbi:KIZ protein, partial [Anseranas semipalmata]|nr:KIZ protein [Anseranas semipalmata]
SETKRLELERELMEYKKSDTYLMKLKYMKLQKYLKEIDERQQRALLRNQTILKEFSRFEAHMKTSSSELIQKMEVWYGREIKSVLSLREGNLSAQGDKEEEHNKQVPWAARQAGMHTGTAVARGLYQPATAFMGCPTLAGWSKQQQAPQPAEPRSCGDEPDGCLARASGDTPCANRPDARDGKAGDPAGENMPVTSTVALADSSKCCSLTNLTEHKNPAECRSLSPDGVSVESRTADLESDTSAEEEVTHQHLAPSAEGYKQPIPVASVPEPYVSEEDQESISEPPACACTATPMAAESGARAGGAHPTEVSVLRLSSPGTAEEQPSGSSAADGVCGRAGSLQGGDLEAGGAAARQQLLQSPPDQPQALDALQASLSCHAPFLAELRLLLTAEEAAATFGNLQVLDEEAPGGQAPPLLREVLPEECGDRSSIQSNESSYSLPSIPNDGGEIKQAEHAPWLDGAGKQGCDIGNNSSKTKESQEMCSERSSSSERSGDLSR